MKEDIIIKGNNQGLTILLDEKANFSNLKSSLKEKILHSRQFFLDAKVTISFTGRELTTNEQQELIDIITSNSNMEIISSKKKNIPKVKHTPMMEDSYLRVKEDKAIFHKGTLRSGQILEVDSSIIVMGDVNPGAQVIAKGNVIILGALRGSVYTDSNEDTPPFVAALLMEPIQIKIGNILGRSSDHKDCSDKNPQIAYLVNDRIIIEAINKSIYKNNLYM